MNILFVENQFGLRGTSVALYDYAHYNEEILGNVSYVAAPADSDMAAKQKFVDRFGDRVLLYEDFQSFSNTVADLYSIDYAYFIKAGHRDGRIVPGVKNFVHVVFNGSEPHGDNYVAVSDWLGEKYMIEYLPHIVSLPKEVKNDFREYLNIPKEATVFGRYGGYSQFDVPYLSEALYHAAEKGRYFLLMNTAPLAKPHPNIMYLHAETDLNVKAAFINTCDAMIHGRTDGETFGLAVAEFLHQNKPVIANWECRDRNHIYVMGDHGMYYRNCDDLKSLLNGFEKKDYNVKHLVDQFKPEVIMNKFKKLIYDRSDKS